MLNEVIMMMSMMMMVYMLNEVIMMMSMMMMCMIYDGDDDNGDVYDTNDR